jgi:hypothetical protein
MHGCLQKGTYTAKHDMQATNRCAEKGDIAFKDLLPTVTVPKSLTRAQSILIMSYWHIMRYCTCMLLK